MRIGILIIATNRYNDFVQPLITSADKYLLTGHNVTYYLFTNEDREIISKRKIIINKVEHREWPWMTLGRYSIFEKYSDSLKEMDYLFYIDADMLIVDNVGDEILSDRVATQHPGYAGERGTPETRPQSTACVYPNEEMQYFAGGFNGGTTYEYLKMTKTISNNIRKDTENGIIAVWHDESHMNRYFLNNPPTTILNPSYCVPDNSDETRYERKILAIVKKHEEYRS